MIFQSTRRNEDSKTDGKEIATARTPDIAEEVAGRLNSEEAQREEDRWA
jgi:hypothetical protein